MPRLHRVFGTAAAAAALVAFVTTTPAAAATCSSGEPPGDGFDTALRGANGKFVTAELNYSGASYGMLRARATKVDTWEKFHIRCLGNQQIAIRAANGSWVSAELAYRDSEYGMLRARATKIGPWETFRYRPLDGASFAEGPLILESVANGKQVSAELSYADADNGMLRARGGNGPWEVWSPTLLDPPPVVPPAEEPPPVPAPAPDPSVDIDAGLGCTPSGEVLKARIRARQPSAGPRPRVRKVVFKVDGRVRRVDRRAPYRAHIRLRYKPGTRHRLTVAVSYVLGAKADTTTVRKRFEMCR